MRRLFRRGSLMIRFGSCFRLTAFVVVFVLLGSSAEAASSKRRHFENRRTAEEFVNSLVRAREFLGVLGLTEMGPQKRN